MQHTFTDTVPLQRNKERKELLQSYINILQVICTLMTFESLYILVS